jgi:glycosyltransferase involved in cell wall biosynthesis
LKICFLYHHSYEVLINDTRVLKEAKSLIDGGNDLVILYGGYSNTGEGYITAYGTKIPCCSAWHSQPKSSMFYFWAIISLFNTSLKQIGFSNLQSSIIHIAEGYKLRAKVYHAHDFQTLLGGYILKKLTGAMLIYDAHELLIESNYFQELNCVSKIIVKHMELILSRRCDVVITVNASIAKIMEERMKIKTPVIIKNMSYYIEEDELINNKLDLHIKLNIPNDELIILYLGWAVKNRGLCTIIDLAKKFPNLHFVIMGKINALSDIDKSLKNLHYLPPVPSDQVIYWAVSADIGLYPMINESLNHYYSLGNKIGEYLMALLPIAVSDFPEMKRIVVDDNVGVTFDSTDFNSITDAITHLTQPEILNKIKMQVRKSRRKYSWNYEEYKLIQLYSEL